MDCLSSVPATSEEADIQVPATIQDGETQKPPATREAEVHVPTRPWEELRENERLIQAREVAINAPRYRRRSSIHFDAIHDVEHQKEKMAPAQLYSTFSGRLFHAGRIVIVLVGPPARGKTHISVALARYLGWLGVKTRVYHLGDYRRATLAEGTPVPDDYFHREPSPSTQLLRQRILKQCRKDIFSFLNNEMGQVAIYDAVNPIADERAALAKEFDRDGVKTLFLESFVQDQVILEANVSNVKLSSPDFIGMDRAQATALYLERLNKSLPDFETLSNKEDFSWIKVIDAGKRIETNDRGFTFIHKRIVLYLMNLQNKSKKIFFARAGRSSISRDVFLSDSSLSDDGVDYAKTLTKTLLEHRKAEHKIHCDLLGNEEEMKPLEIWTSQRKRTVETAQFFLEPGCAVDSKSQLVQLNPGVFERLSAEELDKQYPDERRKHGVDPYHHRWPRGESYHDLAVRLEPVIFELERFESDVLIIAHESVLRVIYGYMMACAAMDIPELQFPRNQIIEIVPGSYTNEASRINIPGVPNEGLPDVSSPGALNLPVCTTPSGSSTPLMTAAVPQVPGAASPMRPLDPRVHPKPSMLRESLLAVPGVNDSGYTPPLSVEDAIVGSEEYFPPIAEEEESTGPLESAGSKTEKAEDKGKKSENNGRRDSRDQTAEIAKALGESKIN